MKRAGKRTGKKTGKIVVAKSLKQKATESRGGWTVHTNPVGDLLKHFKQEPSK